MPDFNTQFVSPPTYKTEVQRRHEAYLVQLQATSDWHPRSVNFEDARRAVAKILHWNIGNVMDWEVVSYLIRTNPAWAAKRGIPAETYRAKANG
jgi:hypothetical protein